MPFKAEPPAPAQSQAKTVEEWIAEAPLKRAQRSTAPWAGLDKKARPVHRFVVELNDYQHALLKAAASASERSMQKEARLRLVSELERACGVASRRRRIDAESAPVERQSDVDREAG